LIKNFCSFARKFAKLPQPGERQVIFFWSSSQSATCYYLFNYSKVEASHQVPCPKIQLANFPACSPHYPFMLNVKQGNCEYQLFKYFGMTRQGLNPGLPTARRMLSTRLSCQ